MNVWLVGGTKRIPTSVEDAIKGDGYKVERISGADRYETAAAIAEAGAKLDGKKPAKAFVASGDSFADALVVSPIAFAKHYPIVLTEKDSTPEVSKKALGNIGSDTKILVGGKAVVSEAVEKTLTVSQRVSGADRAVTANLVADWAKTSEGFQKDDAVLVGGKDGAGADSLVASSFAGKAGYTLHFSGWAATETYLKEHANELTGKGFVIGGKGAVAVADVDKAQAAAQTTPSLSSSIKVAPADASTMVLALGESSGGSTPTFTNNTQDDRTYSVAGLNDDLDYRVTLVNAANIKVGSDGKVLFLSQADANVGSSYTATAGVFVADPGTRSATITKTNSTTLTTAAASVVATPVSGNLKFTVEGAAAESVVPVVYVNGGGKAYDKGGKSPLLELDTTAAGQWASPLEQFGLGGKVSFADVTNVTLDPASKTVASGGTASVTAQLKDGASTPAAVAVAGQDVKFTVTRSGTVVKTGVVKSDAKGQAVYTYDGPAVTGSTTTADVITAFVDFNSDGVKQTNEPTVASGSTFTFSAAVAAETSLKFNNDNAFVTAVGGTQKVSAMVADQYGKPMANKTVSISVTRNGGSTALLTQQVTTGSDGLATVTVTGPTSGSATDVVTVDYTPAGGSALAQGTTSIYWVSKPSVDTSMSSAVNVIGVNADSTFDVALTSTTNARLTYKTGDQFNIRTVAGGTATVKAVDFDTFQKALSVQTAADTVTGTYSVSGVSSFTLTNG